MKDILLEEENKYEFTELNYIDHNKQYIKIFIEYSNWGIKINDNGYYIKELKLHEFLANEKYKKKVLKIVKKYTTKIEGGTHISISGKKKDKNKLIELICACIVDLGRHFEKV